MSGEERSLLTGRHDGYPREATLAALVAARAAERPGAPAVVSASGTLDYAGLCARAARLATVRSLARSLNRRMPEPPPLSGATRRGRLRKEVLTRVRARRGAV